jgi:hypothetical protein
MPLRSSATQPTIGQSENSLYKTLEDIIKEIKEDGQFKKEEEDCQEESAKDEQWRVLEEVQEGLLQIHGIAPNTKQPGIFWIMGKNCNGFKNRIGGNRKIAKELDIKEDLNIDCLIYCVHQLNFHHKDNKNDLKQMFQHELACMAISAHNVCTDKHAGRVQEGGTGTTCFGECTGYIRKVGRNDKGLDRWSWILMGGANRHNTQIIMENNPCKNKNVNSSTLYHQQHQYFITKKKDLTCLLILFRRHLFKQLQQWQAAGEKIVLFMDHNKHMIDGAIGIALTDRDGLDLQEAIFHHTGRSPRATFFRGSKPTDGLWISSNVDISNDCVMPFGYRVGCHRAFIHDIPIESLVELTL